MTRVVIACQGGGSHTAFTAGVLKRLLGAGDLAGYEVAGLSGTSGGAGCALLAWCALIGDDPAGAGQLLERFWTDNSASEPADRDLHGYAEAEFRSGKVTALRIAGTADGGR